MATLYGQQLTKAELLRRVGSVEAVAGVRHMTHENGRAKGLGVYQVTSGPLSFTLNIDKCMDLGGMYYGGMPLHFVARSGEMAPLWYNDGANAARSITGGMLFTCGFGNVGGLQTLENGRTLPQHGYMRTSPACHHGAQTRWQGDEYELNVTAEMREATLFGENIVLRRTIYTAFGSNEIRITDEIENENVHDAPLMLMYHINAGYPLLDENSYAVFDAQATRCRDAEAQAGLSKQDCHLFGPPVDGDPEQVFYHTLANENGHSKAALVNPNLGLGLEIRYENAELPNFIQWKCMASGDYVMGLEPANCYPEGLLKQRETGGLRILKAGEAIRTGITLRVLTGEALVSFLRGQGA
ncbi:MAG: aldose 1-epimerase family protein [Bacillota bacterium]